MNNTAVKQLSIFIENKRGELTDITTLLSNNNVSLKSINLVDSADFGILRIIVDDSALAKKIIDDAGFSLKITEVIAVEIENHVGSFNDVVSTLSDNNINIEYTYTVSNANFGAFIFKVNQSNFNEACKLLRENNIKVLEKI